MTIIEPSAILTPEGIRTDTAVAFDTVIREVAPLHDLRSRYPDARVRHSDRPTLLMPGLINPHVHLEFSANRTTLEYGDFLPWLYSVIEHRESLMEQCDDTCIRQATQTMLANGITAFGAISSRGYDLGAAADAPQKVLFFNELIGSQASMADPLYGDFLKRCEASLAVERAGFTTGVAIHSPYSVHPILVKKALAYATMHGLRVTAHYLESSAELEWLRHSRGDFAPFFESLLKQQGALTDPLAFLDAFEGIPTLMTHVVRAEDAELARLAEAGHTVIHCPVSNRLLGGGAIDLAALESRGIDWVIGTDGLSSNYTLDLFEEMKIALFMHRDTPLLPLALRLLRAATCDAARALQLNAGEIAEGRAADLLWLELDHMPTEQTPVHLLLHRYPIHAVWIDGINPKGDS